MKAKRAVIVLLAVQMLACNTVGLLAPAPTDTPAAVGPTTAPPGGPTPTLCPQATPEPLWVEPIPATTDELTLTLEVRLGNGEAVTVTAESGVFVFEEPFGAFSPTEVEITLLPDTTHHLEVEGRVARVAGFGGCQYGGYTLRTSTDRNGGALEITTGP